MPIGMMVMEWDDRSGASILAKYPEELDVTNKTLMQIVSQHEFSEEAGNVTLMDGAINIISYYTGENLKFYINLLLKVDEDPDDYDGAMPDVARIILNNKDDDAYIRLVPSLFQRIAVFPKLTLEQKLAILYLFMHL